MRAFPARIRKHARFHVTFRTLDLFDIAFHWGERKREEAREGRPERQVSNE